MCGFVDIEKINTIFKTQLKKKSGTLYSFIIIVQYLIMGIREAEERARLVQLPGRFH